MQQPQREEAVARLAEIMETPHSAPGTHLVMLTAYLDESGQESAEHVVIAGFLGSEDNWKTFIPDWSRALGQRKRLHLRELYWNKPRTERLLALAGPVPYTHGLIPLVGVVRVSDYADLLDNPALELQMNGYICALYPIIVEVLRSVVGNERIKWVFSGQTVHEQAARLVFERFTELNCQERLAGVEFVWDEPLTDPADYLAFSVIQQLRDEKSQKAQWCRPILPSRHCRGLVVDRETIRGIVQFTTRGAELQTFLETGKTAQEIVAPYADTRDARHAMTRARTKQDDAFQFLPEARQALSRSHSLTSFVRQYAIGRILGRSPEQALSASQLGLSHSERIRLAAAVDAVLSREDQSGDS